MRRYAVIIEKAHGNFSAHVPDLPGCIATGETADEVLSNVREAMALHPETMAELGIPIPERSTHPDVISDESHSFMIEVSDRRSLGE